MPRLRMTLIAIATLFVAACDSPVLAQDTAQPEIEGAWTGTLETPRGNLTLVIHVKKDEAGTISAELESVDQAPGRRTPVNDFLADDDEMSWKISAIGASYSGRWVASDQQWQGTFNQGFDMALNLHKGLPDEKPIIEGMDGRWEGSAQLNGATLRQVLVIQTGEGGTTVTYSSPDQLANGLAVPDFKIDGQAVTFSIMNGVTSFAGTLNEDRSQLTGQFTTTVNDNVATVTFVRGEVGEREPPKRPQTPQGPFPYAIEEVNFDNPDWPDVHLAATLTLPTGDGPFPVAVMITGSGGQDRDESILGHKPFWVIADYLTRNGIAVLRYDDRGIGESKGNYSSATSADLATDAKAAVAFLKARSDIRHDAIGVIGHSEGGMIGPIAAAGNPDIAFVVLLAGPGTGLEQLMLSQQRLVLTTMGASQADIDRRAPLMAALFGAIAKGETPEAGKAAAKALLTDEAMQTLGAPANMDKDLIVGQFSGPWFSYFLRYDPAPNLRAIKAPILALNGSLDLQVPADDNLAAIAEATKGNPDVTIVKLPGLNHLFQHARTGGVGEYASIEETFAPEALELMGDWIIHRFGTD